MRGEVEMKKKIIRIYFLSIEGFQKSFHMPIIAVYYCTEIGMSIYKYKGRRPEELIFIARITPQKIEKRNHKRNRNQLKSKR
jgi:hypothetical protein